VALTPAGLDLLRVKGDHRGPGRCSRTCAAPARRARNIAVGCLPTIAAGRLPAVLMRFRRVPIRT
jgi:hypothetical protein